MFIELTEMPEMTKGITGMVKVIGKEPRKFRVCIDHIAAIVPVDDTCCQIFMKSGILGKIQPAETYQEVVDLINNFLCTDKYNFQVYTEGEVLDFCERYDIPTSDVGGMEYIRQSVMEADINFSKMPLDDLRVYCYIINS